MTERTELSTPSLFSGGAEDPLAQLDTYCRSRSEKFSEKSMDGSVSVSVSVSVSGPDPDELLSVAEFLFGHKTLSSALAIVDSRHSLITKVVAPSGRFLYVIRSSLSSLSATAADSSRDTPPLRYCSCRSFLEKSTRKASALASANGGGGGGAGSGNGNRYHEYCNDENYQDGPPVCKHLLALFLLPHLVAASTGNNCNVNNYCSQELKSVTEEDFATLILNRVL
eukprot:jgi/Psemu1/284391/fgenesh1_pg.52_\